MSKKAKVCVYCERGDEHMPLLKLRFKGEKFYLCTQHLPTFLHKPEEFVGKLPGFNPLIAPPPEN